MKKVIAAIMCFVMLQGCFPLSFASDNYRVNESREHFSDNPVAIEEISTSIVLLECFDEQSELLCTGSAFAVFDDGVFVTNFHVIEGNVQRIIAHSELGITFEITHVLAFNEDKDIAILYTEENTGILPLDYDDTKTLLKGEKIVAIGSPLGFINTVSTGIISGINKTDSFSEIMFTASISHGSSGGALLNDDGKVIGITYGSYEGGQNLNVAIPIGCVSELYDNRLAPLSIAEYYEMYSPQIFTVDYVLTHRDVIAGEEGILFGYVADIDGKRCSLVASPEYINRCKLSGTQIGGKTSAGSSEGSNGIQTAEEWLKEHGYTSYADRNAFSLCLSGLFAQDNIFEGLHIGDAIKVNVKFLPKYNIEYYTIYIHDKECISVL